MAQYKPQSAERVLQRFRVQQPGVRLLSGRAWSLAVIFVLIGLLSACGEAPSNTSESSAATESPTGLAIAAPSASAEDTPPAQAAPTTVSAGSALPTNTGAVSESLVCPMIDDLPVYTNAICVAQDTDQDDGVTKKENTYLATATADEVRRFFESAFTQNGWTIAETNHQAEDSSWEYTVMKAQRRLKVEVETDQEGGATATKFRLKELSPLAAATAISGAQQATPNCPTIAGLPVFANATCIKHDTDQDDGITKNQNTYVTNATIDDVQRFYASAFSQNGWAITESKHDVQDNDWSYTLTQAQRRVKLEIEPRQGTTGIVTRITIEEK